MVLDISFISKGARSAFNAVASIGLQNIGVACPVAIVNYRSSKPHQPSILSPGQPPSRVFKEGLSTMTAGNRSDYNISTKTAEKLRTGDVLIGVVAPFYNKKSGMMDRTFHPVVKIKSDPPLMDP